MTLIQPVAARSVSTSLETPRLAARRLDGTGRSIRQRTSRAREARLKLNGPRGRGDFSHLGRVYD